MCVHMCCVCGSIGVVCCVYFAKPIIISIHELTLGTVCIYIVCVGVSVGMVCVCVGGLIVVGVCCVFVCVCGLVGLCLCVCVCVCVITLARLQSG
jgi:hypothetical protein